ncbi:hypothetical protein F2Q70_00018730 [Brassica cretica]|uniref:Uncharacterized protein n=1 Tax=Brassica cretica TaxID=69181 RepID=A0A8S9I2E6_BRACR|nr:hypothetical protein F2Q70_00018730 [Brassica cretica]
MGSSYEDPVPISNRKLVDYRISFCIAYTCKYPMNKGERTIVVPVMKMMPVPAPAQE